PLRPSRLMPGLGLGDARTSRLRACAAIILAVVTLFTATACGPDRGLRVESEANPSPTLFETPNADAGPPNKPFSLKQIRKAIEDASGVAVTGKATETAKVLADCEDCLKFSKPFTSSDRHTDGKKKFQVVAVANPKQKSEIVAGAVISEKDAKPRLELIATGNQLTLNPGKNGTLVIQEAMFVDGDDPRSPSGWSVQVFRLHEGRFEPGQRFTRLNGET
ncbi:MAG: hypothetical protein ACTIC1_20410, partial [Brevibacterium sp.]